MPLILTLLLWLVVALLVLLLALVMTPIKVQIRLKTAPKLRFIVIARPFGGLTPALTMTDSGQKAKPKDKADKKRRKKRKRGGRFAVNGPALITALPDLVSGLLQCFRIESLSLDGEFGLGDPADTGHLYGSLTPFIFGTAGMRNTYITLRPNFERRCLSGVAETRLSITPATLVPPILGFAWRVFGPRL